MIESSIRETQYVERSRFLMESEDGCCQQLRMRDIYVAIRLLKSPESWHGSTTSVDIKLTNLRPLLRNRRLKEMVRKFMFSSVD